MLAGLFSCFYSEFNQFPSVSGLFIEPAEFETVVGEFFIRRMFPFGFIAAEHIPYIFRGSVKVVVFGVDDPCQPAIRRVGAQPDSLAGVRVSDEQRMNSACSWLLWMTMGLTGISMSVWMSSAVNIFFSFQASVC